MIIRTLHLKTLKPEDYALRLSWLSASEQEQVLSLGNEGAQRLRIAGRSLARELLARELGCAPADVSIKRTENGKPVMASGELHFSISHTDGLAVCAVDNAPVGVDAERRGRHVSEALMRRVASADELSLIGDDAQLFLRLWTLKEAYVKAVDGVLLTTQRVHFTTYDGLWLCSEEGFSCGTADTDDHIISWCRKED